MAQLRLLIPFHVQFHVRQYIFLCLGIGVIAIASVGISRIPVYWRILRLLAGLDDFLVAMQDPPRERSGKFHLGLDQLLDVLRLPRQIAVPINKVLENGPGRRNMLECIGRYHVEVG